MLANIRSFWNRNTKADEELDDLYCVDLTKDGVEIAGCGRVGAWRLETPLSVYRGLLSEAGWHGFSGAYTDAVRDCHLSDDPALAGAKLALQDLSKHIEVIDPLEGSHYAAPSPEVTIVRK